MREWSRSPVVRYGMILVAFAATASVVTLFPRLHLSNAAILLLFPVMVGAWCAGTRAAFLVAALGGVLLVVLPYPPLASGEHVWGERLLTLILYAALSICISSLLRAFQSSRQAANVGARALLESRERHQHLLETVHEGVWILDAHGSTLSVNRQMSRLLGYTADEILGRPWIDFLSTASRQDGQRLWDRRKEGFTDQHELLLRCRDGTELWTLATINPSYSAEGDSGGVLVAMADITPRKHAEQALRFVVDATQVLASSLDYESTLRSVARLTVPSLADWCILDILQRDGSARPLAVIHTDPEKEKRASELWRSSQTEVPESIGLTKVLRTGKAELYRDLADPHLEDDPDDARQLAILRKLGCHSVLVVPVRVRGKTLGSITLASDTPGRCYSAADLTLIENLARRAALAVDNALLYEEAQTEITERKQVETALRESTEHLRNQQKWLEGVLDLMPAPTVFIEPVTGRVIFANKAANEMGCKDVSKNSCGDEHRTAYICTDATGTPIPDDEMPGARLARGERLDKFEMNWHSPNGIRSLLLYGDTIPAMCGHPAMAVMKFYEITQLKQVEAELRQAGKAKDEFLAMLAHELRNPLAPLLTSLYYLRLHSIPNDGLGHARDMAERQVRHLARLVDDLLDVARITRGKIELRKEPAELSTLVSRVIDASQPFLEERRQEMAITLPAEPIFLEVDVIRIEQVLMNLLHNAAKYNEEGGQVWLTVESDSREAVIRVRDSGIGIPPETLPHVFDLFVQADCSLARSQGGLGIGLTLVQSLVKMHGGSIQAHSEGRGKGSEFVVRLPLHSVKSPECEEPRKETGASNGRSVRVLVVDDNVDAVLSLALVLETMGHVVRTAYDGPAALEEADAFQPQIILLDIGLPVMDGYEVARQLRQEGRSQEVFLVALTGYGQEEDRQRSRDAGFDMHLVKPVDPEALQELLSGRKAAGVAV